MNNIYWLLSRSRVAG